MLGVVSTIRHITFGDILLTFGEIKFTPTTSQSGINEKILKSCLIPTPSNVPNPNIAIHLYFLLRMVKVKDEIQCKGKGKGKTWKQNHKQIIEMKRVFFFTFDEILYLFTTISMN